MAHRYNKWTDYEDNALTQLVQKYGVGHWSTIAKEMKSSFEIHKRNGKQCRQRWFNHLDHSNVNRKWTEAEDLQLIQVQAILGTKWIEIAKHFPGRSDNNVKNHFYSIVKKSVRRMCRYVSIKTTSMKVYSIKPSTLSRIFVEAASKSADVQSEEAEASSNGLDSRFKKQDYCEITQIIHFFIFDNQSTSDVAPPLKEKVIEALNKVMDLNNIFLKDSNQDKNSHSQYSGSEKKDSSLSKNESSDKEIQEMEPQGKQQSIKSQRIELIQKVQIEEQVNSHGIFSLKTQKHQSILEPSLVTIPCSSKTLVQRKDLMEDDEKVPVFELLRGPSQMSLGSNFPQISLNEFDEYEMKLYMTPRKSGYDSLFNRYLQ